MQELELILALLVVVAVIVTLARKLGVAYPILLVFGGLVVALLPGMPAIEVEPELVLILFLPPLLFAAAWQTPIRDLRRDRRAIGLLSVGLVLFTTLLVAVVAVLLIAGMPIAAAFALGAIVSPPDAVAATTILRRLDVPRRIVTVLEGESMLNDATALTAYRVAVSAAAAAGSIVLAQAVGSFVQAVVVGILVGVIVAIGVGWLWNRLFDPPVEVTLSLVIPYVAYLPAEQLGGSGVIATVAAGLYLGYRSSRILASDTRVLATGVWQIVTFLLEGFAFLLIGLELPPVIRALSDRNPAELLVLAGVISLTVIAARFVWVYPVWVLPRWISARLRGARKRPPAAARLVVAWAGMRGAVSMVAALSLPRTFPDSTLIQFLTFSVILVTLIGPGLTLPTLLRRLGLSDGGAEAHEETVARRTATDAALAELDQLFDRWPGHHPLIENLRERYAHRAEHLDAEDGSEIGASDERTEHRAIMASLINAEREAVIGLRDQGVISDVVLRRIERDLDLEELRLEADV